MNGRGVQSHFNVFHGVMGVYLTNACNATCTHCCTSSGPKKNSAFEIELFLEFLNSDDLFEHLTTIHVSGGEPFMSIGSLKSIGEVAAKKGLALAVNTNGFWGRNFNTAKRTVQEIPGLTQVLLSTSIYHTAFVKIDAVKNAASAALEQGCRVTIGVCSKPGESANSFLAELRNQLGQQLVDAVEIIQSNLEPIGRAEELPEASWKETSSTLPEGNCHLINRPVVLQSGRISACCNTTVTEKLADTSPLIIGNISRDRINNLRQMSITDPFIQALRLRGPAFLAGLAEEGNCTKLGEHKYRSRDICQLCQKIMENPVFVEEIRIKLQDTQLRKQLLVEMVAENDEWNLICKKPY